MKLSKYSSRALAMVLALCLSVTLVPDAMAAGKGKAKGKNKTTTSTVTEDTGSTITELTLVEDETTVTEGTSLRASTYAATTLADDGTETQAGSTTRKYFPVTMYNYDDRINNATHQVEVDGGLGNTWDGIYFNNGTPKAESYSEEFSIEDGTYIIQNARAAANNVGSWLVGNTNGITSTTNQSEATQWTVKSNGDGTYTLNSTNGYMTIGSGENGEKTATTASNIKIVGYTGQTYDGCVQLNSGSYYLCQWGGNDKTVYGGYDVNNNTGNAFYFYKVTDSGTTKVSIPSVASRSYASWNGWTGNIKDNGEIQDNAGENGNRTYSGLVESILDANKDIKFTKPEGGIFNSDATVKDIYTGVEMPFVYENGTYTFDASQNGVYFYKDSTQGSTTAQSNGRLYFNEGNPQSNGKTYGDNSQNVWMPFNSTQKINGEANCDYHFGMRTTIPFTMTANGKMNPNDDTSEDITFSFSGDDDVWVFIDGQLIIDLGGIHNRLDATINFAENTWSLSKSNTSDGDIADYNGAAISGTLFNDGDTTGTLNQTRETFVATDSHELTIFYLERGAGSSNCKIEFNLPMKDTVSVRKIANQSKTADGKVSDLTDEEKTMVANTDFGFTLYKTSTAEDGTISTAAVANTNYNLLNANGQVISTPSTDEKGHFTLKADQTAKFVGTIDSTNGNSYYVVEDENSSFQTPSYTFTAEAANGSSQIKAADGWTSMTVQATGSDEAEDSVVFTCTNYLNADLPNPTSNPADDKIVIDYGLPVNIDVLSNDVHKGSTYELTSVSEGKYGTATQNDDGTITYQLTKPLTGVEVLTYTATAGNGTNTVEGTANIYIIPATSMYYEEDFSDLVTYRVSSSSTTSWSSQGSAMNDKQEPGVVGTVDDSPYGSDIAYKDDSTDSNNTSQYVDTTTGAAQFSYTFTGTGTSFFARTTNQSGYMRVVITDEEGKNLYNAMRDTSYKTDDDKTTLYNIPVFTWDGQDYGTYTVTVTIAKQNTSYGYGKDFWLDGIRVINPLDSDDGYASVATSAYATDGEANMTVVTLREKLLGEASINEDGTLSWDGTNFVVFTDSNGIITAAEEYKSNGPKEEVYLDNDQSVTFSLQNWDANSNKIYLGIKAPFGSGSVSINNNTVELKNAVDCYYDISKYANIDSNNTATFTIKSTSSLVSITNIKVTGNAEFTIVNQDDVDVN